MNGELHILQHGKNFNKDPQDFAKSARKYARRYGKKAAVRSIGDKIFLQFFEVEDK
ncbi:MULTISPECIES: hypothetical protein [Streptomyces]|uniref:hypothetical protein n=1 Tax=Streptomyces TaxID=1883 RepID=UPI001872CDD0|nr:hypothetical protein [Streptomyces caniscabiei]MBE4797396.1 hypothetical protein [Streptomyces caniscabiei]